MAANTSGDDPDDRDAGDADRDPRDEMPPDPFGPDDPALADIGSDASAAATAAAGPGDAFAGMGMFGSLFGDLSRQLAAQGPLSWDTARQTAVWAATEGRPESNVDPIERIKIEELCRVAEMHVADATGLDVSDGGRGVLIETVTRAQWAARFLDEQRPLLEGLASALATPPGQTAEPGDPTADLFAGMLRMMGPALLGMQAGGLAGHLARRCVGSYDLPLPRPTGAGLLFVPINLAAFASDWSLPLDSVRMRTCLVELTHHAVFRIPHVHERLSTLLRRFASSYRVDPSAFEEQLASVDPSDPATLQRVLGDPQAMLGAITSPEQGRLRTEIDAIVGATVGYVDHIVERTSSRLIGGDSQLAEAMRRRRIEAGGADRMAERLLGLTLDRALFDRGGAFVSGVVERAGDDGLARLWASADSLPTPAELDAPGLWLARLDLG